jgi:hypothetical protein
MNPIDIADLDCIYLSYDEPEKEEYWIRIRNMVPWAKRVDGVLGSDAAHKAAALASSTERFILIDGDNIPDPAFFNQTLSFPTSEYEKAVFRWRARNHVNGLMYGNGGLSLRNRALMALIATEQTREEVEPEDVFFSRHLPSYCKEFPPLEMAQAFASEAIYSDAIGIHASWKYLPTEQQASLYEKHIKTLIAMVEGLM